MQQAFTGLLVTLLTQGAKKVSAIPVTDAQKGRIRTLVIALTAVTTVGAAWLDGSLATSTYPQLIGEGLISWMFSVSSYHGLIRSK